MKTLALIFLVLWGSWFCQGVTFVELSAHTLQRAPSEANSSGGDDRSSKNVPQSRSSSQEQTTAAEHPGISQRASRSSVSHGDSGKGALGANSRKERLKPVGSQAHPTSKPIVAHPTSNSGNSAAPYGPVLSQSPRPVKEAPLKGAAEYHQNRSFETDTSQRDVALPVNPARNRPAAAVIGGPTLLPAAKNPAVLNGTGLKHKP